MMPIHRPSRFGGGMICSSFQFGWFCLCRKFRSTIHLCCRCNDFFRQCSFDRCSDPLLSRRVAIYSPNWSNRDCRIVRVSSEICEWESPWNCWLLAMDERVNCAEPIISHIAPNICIRWKAQSASATNDAIFASDQHHHLSSLQLQGHTYLKNIVICLHIWCIEWTFVKCTLNLPNVTKCVNRVAHLVTFDRFYVHLSNVSSIYQTQYVLLPKLCI